MIRYRKELKVWKEKKEHESEINAIARHTSFVTNMSNSLNSGVSEEIVIGSLPDEGDSSVPKVVQDSFNSSHSSLGSFSTAERRRMHSNSMNLMIQRQQQILRQQLRDENSNFMVATRTANSPSQLSYNALPGSNAFHQSFSSMPSRFSDFEEPLADFQQPQTMEQLQRQQQRQLEQMRQLQIQQHIIQQQIEMQRNNAQINAMNNMNRGHSSFSDIMSQPTMAQPHNQMQFQSGMYGNSLMEQSMNLGEALLAPSVHVSDYSRSEAGHHSGSGFGASSRSFAMSHSDSTAAGSYQGGIGPQIYNRQQHNSFTGQLPTMRSQPDQGVGGFAFSSNEEEQQHDLRRMMDMDG